MKKDNRIGVTFEGHGTGTGRHDVYVAEVVDKKPAEVCFAGFL